MKKNMFIIFVIMFFSLLVNHVSADCTKEEINSLKKEAEKIRVIYKHLGAVDSGEGFDVYDRFNVTFKNVNNDFYVIESNSLYKSYPTDGIITDNFVTGTWFFDINSTKCNMKIYSIKVVLPKFNVYSLDPLCDGIDGDDFALCNKYYSGEVSYDFFEKKVLEYRSTHKNDADENENGKNSHKKSFSDYLNVVYDFVSKNVIYFSLGIISVVILFVVLIIQSKKRKRGVLR